MRQTFPDPKPTAVLRCHRLVLDGTAHAPQLRAAGDTGQGFPEILPPAPFRFELPDGSLCESPCLGLAAAAWLWTAATILLSLWRLHAAATESRGGDPPASAHAAVRWGKTPRVCYRARLRVPLLS